MNKIIVGSGNDRLSGKNDIDVFVNPEAFIMYLEHYCGFDVKKVSGLEEIIKSSECKQMLSDCSMLLLESHHFSNNDFLIDLSYIDFLRKNLPSNSPIFLLSRSKEFFEEFDILKKKNVFLFRIYDELVPAVQKIKMQRDKKKNSIELSNLVNAYRVNYSDRMLTPMDENSMAVIEYLRCRLMGSEIIGLEYDSTLPQKPSAEKSESKKYFCDMNSIVLFSNSERELFRQDLNFMQGIVVGSDGLKRVTPIASSLGESVGSYAFDVITREQVEIIKFGYHKDGARKVLQSRFYAMNKFRQISLEKDVSNLYSAQIISGRTFYDVPLFDVPILLLFLQGVSLDIARELGEIIISEQKYLPIDENMILVDKNYVPPK